MNPTLAFNLALARVASLGYRRCVDWSFNLPSASLISDGSWTRPLGRPVAKIQVHRTNRRVHPSWRDDCELTDKQRKKRAENQRNALRRKLRQQALALVAES